MSKDRFRFRVWDKRMKCTTDVVCLNMGTWSDIILIDPRGNHIKKETYCTEIENVILEQCTGVKDKNGTLIFEGDVLRDKKGHVYDVYFCTHRKVLSLISEEHNELLALYTAKDMQIIKNIHEEESCTHQTK